MSTLSLIRLLLLLSAGLWLGFGGNAPKAEPAKPAKAAKSPKRGLLKLVKGKGKKATKKVSGAVEPGEAFMALPPLPDNLLSRDFIHATPPPIAGTCEACAEPLLATAYSLIGIRYRRGGSSPDYGFDCSGFTRYVYQSNFDIELPTSAPAQFLVGVPVERNELMPGDLVFFRHRWRGWHVGMYVGLDSFIHAPNHRKTVTITLLSDPYFKTTYAGARRIPLAGVAAASLRAVATN